MRRLLPLVLTLAALVACGAEPQVAPAPPSPPAAPIERAGDPPPPREDGRLPSVVRPVRYALALDIDPRKERFRGTTTISIEVKERTFHVVLHALDLKIARVTATNGAVPNPVTMTSRPSHGSGGSDELVLTFQHPLEVGATLDVKFEYDAAFAPDLGGLYRVKEGDAWYAFTKFEPTDARRMFPCFDEPAFKVPFDVTVTTPKGMIAAGNSPEATRTAADDTMIFRFATSKPLPTYLVALAVGDFDVRVGATDPTPVRILTPKGKGELAQYALDATTGLTRVIADYLHVPFPYAKLDVVAVPEFVAGAMENAGFITFREEILLLDPHHPAARARRSLTSVLAHEIAHQWFGDLVTNAWWDDVWLNEAMATWMAPRVVDTWQPAFGAKVDLVGGGLWVMDQDSLAAARTVRQPVRSTAEAREAFDGITYTKGAALLSMIEQWIGPDTFQQALHDYLQNNAWKSATASALLGTFDLASRKDVTGMASTFLDHTGVPVVTARLACEQAGRWYVELQQEAWRPLGSAAKDTQQTWTHPVCVRPEGRAEPACTLLAGGAPSMIAGTGKCPAWVMPNDGSKGYYRYTESPAELLALTRALGALDPPSRLSLLSNVWASARAGLVGPEQLLKILPAYDKDNERVVVENVAGTLSAMNDTVVADDVRPQFRAFVAARLGRHKTALGWTPGAKDDDDRTLLRRTILFAMADLAGDATTLREAEPIAQAWLRDPSSVDPDIGAAAIEIASRTAGDARLEALRDAAKRAKTPQDRIVALRGMGSFDEPALLERALDLVLTDEIKSSEARYVIWTAGNRRATKPVLLKWIEARWDKLRAKQPGRLGHPLVGAASLVCSAADKDAAAAFFSPRSAAMEGSARTLASALESASLCAELRAHGTDAVSKALRAQRRP